MIVVVSAIFFSNDIRFQNLDRNSKSILLLKARSIHYLTKMGLFSCDFSNTFGTCNKSKVQIIAHQCAFPSCRLNLNFRALVSSVVGEPSHFLFQQAAVERITSRLKYTTRRFEDDIFSNNSFQMIQIDFLNAHFLILMHIIIYKDTKEQSYLRLDPPKV